MRSSGCLKKYYVLSDVVSILNPITYSTLLFVIFGDIFPTCYSLKISPPDNDDSKYHNCDTNCQPLSSYSSQGAWLSPLHSFILTTVLRDGHCYCPHSQESGDEESCWLWHGSEELEFQSNPSKFLSIPSHPQICSFLVCPISRSEFRSISCCSSQKHVIHSGSLSFFLYLTLTHSKSCLESGILPLHYSPP